jgi:putative iron-dependent peroxidase
MKSAAVLSKQLKDIQGILRSGYGWLHSSTFWLLTIKDGRENEARAWLATLAHDEGLLVSAARVGQSRTEHIDGAIAVAFSYLGLQKLGCAETDVHPFPTPFRSGMGSELRASLLKEGPGKWRWSDAEGPAGGEVVHVLIAELTDGKSQLVDGKPRIPDIDPDVFGVIKVDNDPCSFQPVKDDPVPKLFEVFGFRDGLAQPTIRGFREEQGARKVRQDAGPMYDDRVVAPGEFILGYRNEYDELTYCPNVKGWPGDATYTAGRFALNGSYLAVRQIKQNVKAFQEFEALNGRDICEKLMGRRKTGLPLSWEGDPNASVSDSKADAFRFRVDDTNGFACPKGSHIRRVNPRDSLGVDVKSSIKSTKLHRLLRRGRPYLEKDKNYDPHNGIFFIACNADLERQFEFIQQRWVRNPRFGCLHDQDDPVVGATHSPKKFSMPGLASGEEVSLSAFTETLGGGYFFLPGIKALKFIVNHVPSP